MFSINKSEHEKTRRLVGMAILTALVLVLQAISANVKFGPFTITLTLIPIVIGGILYGAKFGAALGGIFGIIVYITCISGLDAGGYMLFSVNPVYNGVQCIGKGILAGFIPAVVYKPLANKNITVATVVAALLAPVVNTGAFLLFMFTVFYDVLCEWAGNTPIAVYVVTILVGLNFIVEFAVSAVMSPAIVTVIREISKRQSQ